ncbi:MAG: hypothetical protein ABL950_02470 [Nitrospira sp.]
MRRSLDPLPGDAEPLWLTPTGRDLSGTESAKPTIACLSDSMVLFSAPSLYR